MSGFENKRGLHEAFFEAAKVGHLAVEAPIDSVSAAISGGAQFFRIPQGRRIEVRTDMLGHAVPSDAAPLATVFQLSGQPWTQAVTELRQVRHLPLGLRLSKALDTRVIAAEVTDDLYYTHAVFDRGVVGELQIAATKADVRTVLGALGIAIPQEYAGSGKGEWDDFDEAEFGWRGGAEEEFGRDLETVVSEAGCYLHHPSWSAGTPFQLLDVEPADVVRLDAVWLI